MQRFIKFDALLCRECGTALVRSYTARTLIQGWWGIFSLFIANPFTIVMNLKALFEVRRFPEPEYTLVPAGLTSANDRGPSGPSGSAGLR